MSSIPSFSIIAPVYGVEKYIVDCADSLLGQTYDNIQFVFVNDGTKDDSIVLLEKLINERYADRKDQIIIVNKQNAGLPAARKTGMEYATGDYILHVDSDDWVEKDMVEKIASKAVETDSDVIYFDFYKEYSTRSKLDREKEYTSDTKMRFIWGLFNYKAYGYVWNKCVKRSVYEKNEIRFPLYGMHEDIFLMSQLLFYAESMVHLPLALYHYRRGNPGSISAAKRKNRRYDSAKNMMDMYQRYMDDLTNSPIRDSYSEILFRTGWLSIRYGFGFFEEFPYLAQHIRKTPLSFKNKTFILWQVITKMRALFR